MNTLDKIKSITYHELPKALNTYVTWKYKIIEYENGNKIVHGLWV